MLYLCGAGSTFRRPRADSRMCPSSADFGTPTDSVPGRQKQVAEALLGKGLLGKSRNGLQIDHWHISTVISTKQSCTTLEDEFLET